MRRLGRGRRQELSAADASTLSRDTSGEDHVTTALDAIVSAGHRPQAARCGVELEPAGTHRVRVVRLSGEPDVRDGRRAHQAMTAALLDAPRAIVVDVSDVERMDGSGVMLLLLMRRHARRLGATLPVAGAAPDVARSLQEFDRNGLLSLYSTASEAIDAHSRTSSAPGRVPTA
jgi:anti-anti-sigma factor